MRRPTVLAAAALVAALGACGAGQDGSEQAAGTSTSPSTPTTSTTAAPAAPTSATSPDAQSSSATATPTPAPSATPTPTPSPTPTPTPGPSGACLVTALRLTREQQVGQLLMVGLDASSPSSALDGVITAHHVGNVIYLGGFTGAARVARTSAHLQSLATPENTGGAGLLVAADQEGGVVRQLRGPGFTPLPRARTQGRWDAARLTATATRTARELRAVGVNVDLAPVADTVPADIGTANDPIGRWGREYGSDPDTVSAAVSAVTRGLVAGGVGATVKHFPGLGRIPSNTDFSANGITDSVLGADDPGLGAFTAGATAGAAVMVSSARYPRLDPANQAVFSRPIVTGLLRQRLGFGGLVMTDDMGGAVAVAGTPAGQRAVRFVDAGGDLVITGRPDTVDAMAGALLARAGSDPAFAGRVTQSAARVLDYKTRLGLARCS